MLMRAGLSRAGLHDFHRRDEIDVRIRRHIRFDGGELCQCRLRRRARRPVLRS